MSKITAEHLQRSACVYIRQSTPDQLVRNLESHGGPVGGSQRPRARQNVVLELGFFLGKLEPANVAALIKGDVEKPSDFDGIAYIAFDAGGNWKKGTRTRAGPRRCATRHD